jgi:hypothetical protein
MFLAAVVNAHTQLADQVEASVALESDSRERGHPYEELSSAELEKSLAQVLSSPQMRSRWG